MRIHKMNVEIQKSESPLEVLRDRIYKTAAGFCMVNDTDIVATFGEESYTEDNVRHWVIDAKVDDKKYHLIIEHCKFHEQDPVSNPDNINGEIDCLYPEEMPEKELHVVLSNIIHKVNGVWLGWFIL